MSKKKRDDNVKPKVPNIDAQNPTLGSNKKKTEPEPISKNQKPHEEDELSFIEKWKTNRFLIVRGTYFVLHSVWMVIMVVGGFIAWLIALLFI